MLSNATAGIKVGIFQRRVSLWETQLKFAQAGVALSANFLLELINTTAGYVLAKRGVAARGG